VTLKGGPDGQMFIVDFRNYAHKLWPRMSPPAFLQDIRSLTLTMTEIRLTL